MIAPDDFHRISALTAKRDKAAMSRDRRARAGRPSTRYALAKLATCDRCGARMYSQTSPYKRRDGTQQRSYVCGNVRDSTGVCDEPSLTPSSSTPRSSST